MAAEYWRGKKVLVTGGSAGFGFHLADAFLRAGAEVAISGRDPQRLADAAQRLSAASADVSGPVITLTGDASDQASVREQFGQLRESWDTLDALVNNIGVSDRGRVLDLSADKLQSLWSTNVLTALLMTQAALPLLRASRGHIVNIGSLAAKSAARFLGGYAMSKFPIAAFSQQLRYELADDGIHVLLVCPGPIDREDAGQRYNDLAEDLPEQARQPGGGVQLKRLDPQRLAQQVLLATQRRKAELVMPAKSRLLFAISQLNPAWGDWILKRKGAK